MDLIYNKIRNIKVNFNYFFLQKLVYFYLGNTLIYIISNSFVLFYGMTFLLSNYSLIFGHTQHFLACFLVLRISKVFITFVKRFAKFREIVINTIIITIIINNVIIIYIFNKEIISIQFKSKKGTWYFYFYLHQQF